MSVDIDLIEYTTVIINLLTIFIGICCVLATISNCIYGSDEIEDISTNNLINEFANNSSKANTISKTIESIEQNKVKNN